MFSKAAIKMRFAGFPKLTQLRPPAVYCALNVNTKHAEIKRHVCQLPQSNRWRIE